MDTATTAVERVEAGYRERCDALALALADTDDPRVIIEIEAQLDAFEQYMRSTGLYRTDEIRPVNETRMRARWKLGRALAIVERGHGPGRGKDGRDAPTFSKFIKQLGLEGTSAKEAQRIGTLPEPELDRALADAHQHDILNTFAELIDRARPYWYQASRKAKHRIIAINSAALTLPAGRGPFPLIYADPPWKFEIYSEKGLERTPDQHYPTLSDEEIKRFAIDGEQVPGLAHRDAALLMWCTSSNLVRALEIMAAWGFKYKSQAMWVKTKDDGRTPISGLGLVFRNMHEVLLYGTRGSMPGPQYQPPSVFLYPRGRHSAKPPEIRREVEKMYPDFDENTRLELFAREALPGWTCHGFEAFDRSAAVAG